MKNIYLTIIFLAFSLSAHSTTIRNVLEKHDLCEYKSMHIAQGKDGSYFLTVVLPGGLYSATAIVGSYVGNNSGKILEITENNFEIVELVLNKNGDWEEKSTRVTVENNSIDQHCSEPDKYNKLLKPGTPQSGAP